MLMSRPAEYHLTNDFLELLHTLGYLHALQSCSYTGKLIDAKLAILRHQPTLDKFLLPIHSRCKLIIGRSLPQMSDYYQVGQAVSESVLLSEFCMFANGQWTGADSVDR